VKPSVGKVVHYVSYGTPGGEYHSQCRAAVIAEVGQWITTKIVEEIPGQQRVVHQAWEPEACALVVLNPQGLFFNGAAGVVCEHDELPPSDKIVAGERTTHRGGTWHWPERVDDD
jgi:hypothetical protein